MHSQTLPDTVQEQRGHQHLTFVVQGETYAVDTLCVREIIEYGQLTAVPLMPACICGVINLRGAVVPVIDLRARFGGAITQGDSRTCIVILEMGEGIEAQVLGVIVDAVSEVLDIAPADVRPAPAFGSRIRGDFIAGMVKVDAAFVTLLKVEQVLDVEELAALARAAR